VQRVFAVTAAQSTLHACVIRFPPSRDVSLFLDRPTAMKYQKIDRANGEGASGLLCGVDSLSANVMHAAQ
jgi:hypothetical protein